MQNASDAIDLLLAQIRPDLTKGTVGWQNTPPLDYGAATATCTGQSSGAVMPGFTADRTVYCFAVNKGSATKLVQTRVRILDHNGNDPGYEVQILDRYVAG